MEEGVPGGGWGGRGAFVCSRDDPESLNRARPGLSSAGAPEPNGSCWLEIVVFLKSASVCCRVLALGHANA